MPSQEVSPVARLREVSLRYDQTTALDAVSIDFPAGRMVGIIGPDGVGKSSMLALVAGARAIQSGQVEVLGGDMADEEHRRQTCPRVAYMPQGLGKNLYPSLSVFENIDFFARLFGQGREERYRRIAELLKATGLDPFRNRPVGKLSGGMKQKLGLCCALIHDPDLLILDEPTTGVDPLSRRQFWELIETIRARRPGMSMLVATAYMEEAARFDWLVAMNAGKILATGSTRELLEFTGKETLEETFIALLPREQREGYRPLSIPAREGGAEREVAIEARDLTMRFGDFIAVDHVSFQIFRGEIFGFLGSNGCGKTTTMKMLTGLLPATEGEAWLFGHPVDAKDIETRRRVGYMTQGFSLYGQLTVRQNLVLHARLFSMPETRISARVREMAERFDLADVMGALPDALPLGQRQRLSLAVAMIHNPELLILDEPTSGVDPVAREAFWQIMVNLARLEKVTIFISTHFMNEAERCDRISLMHAGRVLVSDTPEALVKARGTNNLEDAFIRYLQDATEESAPEPHSVAVKEVAATTPTQTERPVPPAQNRIASFDLQRLLSYARREALELSRDPVRLTLAMLGSVILMFVMGYGISLDVDELNFAVLDRDQTTTSRDYVLDIVGSRYFIERAPIRDYADMDRRMRSGEISLALEIPPDFGRKLARGDPVQIGAWVDGAMPTRGETIRSYAEGAHAHWLNQKARETLGTGAAVPPANIETRFRYNPNVESLIAMVPGVIPLLLMLIPAILTALAVVREKELGSIINFYVTPVTRIEFLLGKQLPYILLAMLSFLLLTAQAVLVLRVPLKGSFLALSTGALVYVIVATAFGLVISSFMRSQIAALFGTAVLTLLPVIQFSGMIEPVPSLEGIGAFIGRIYPTSHFLTISRGTFAKALGFADLGPSFVPLLIAAPVLIGLSVMLLKKQAR